MEQEQDDEGSIPFDLTDTDRENLAKGDESFQPHTWEDLQKIIGSTSSLVTLLDPLPLFVLQRRTISQS